MVAAGSCCRADARKPAATDCAIGRARSLEPLARPGDEHRHAARRARPCAVWPLRRRRTTTGQPVLTTSRATLVAGRAIWRVTPVGRTAATVALGGAPLLVAAERHARDLSVPLTIAAIIG